MNYAIALQDGHLLATLEGRETAFDMQEFLLAVKAACREHDCPRVLISIRNSRPVFKAEHYGLAGYANDLVTPACRIALVGDTSELHFAHEYIELVARQQHVNARSFRDAAAALRWLHASDDRVSEPQPGELDWLQPAGAPKLA